MKQIAYLAMSMSLCFGSQVFAQANEEAAIRKTLSEIRSAFDKRDLDAFTRNFVKSPDLVYVVYTTVPKFFVAQGWEAMTHMVEGYMKQNPNSNINESPIGDVQIHVNGNSAWVVLKGSANLPGEMGIMVQHFYVFQKYEGRWQVTALTSQQYRESDKIVVK